MKLHPTFLSDDLARWKCDICGKGFIYDVEEHVTKHLLKHEKEELIHIILLLENTLEDERLEAMEEYD